MSCHWTTPQRRLHPRTWPPRHPDPRGRGRGLQGSAHARILQVWCTLSRGVRTTRRRLGALVSAMLPLFVGVLAPIVAAPRAVAARWPTPPCPGADLRPGPADAAVVD